MDARAGDAEQSALPTDRRPLIGAVEHRHAIRGAHLPDLRDKNPAPRSARRYPGQARAQALACSFSIYPRGPPFRFVRHQGRTHAPPAPEAASSRHGSGPGCTSWRWARSAAVDSSRTVSSAIFTFGAASILRLVRFVIIRFAYHDGTALAQSNPRSQVRGHFACAAELRRRRHGERRGRAVRRRHGRRPANSLTVKTLSLSPC